MVSYREYAHGVQRRMNLPLDDVLASIAVVLKSLGKTLTPDDTRVMRVGLAPELYQIIVARGAAQGDGRDRRPHDASRTVSAVAAFLELPHEEAKRRSLAVLQELKAEFPVFEDSAFLELIDRLSNEVSEVFTPPDAGHGERRLQSA